MFLPYRPPLCHSNDGDEADIIAIFKSTGIPYNRITTQPYSYNDEISKCPLGDKQLFAVNSLKSSHSHKNIDGCSLLILWYPYINISCLL